MPARHLRGVRGGVGALSRSGGRAVVPERYRGRVGERREKALGDRADRLEVVEDPAQLTGEPIGFPLGKVQRGEPRHPADEVAVDPHGFEYSQRLDASRRAPLPSRAIVSLPSEPRAALARLARRSAVRLARAASESSGTPFLLVGGAVRDALLGLPPGDLDLAVPREGAAGFAAALARLAGTRVAPIGRAPRRILHVPLRRSSVDVWETEGEPADDLLRRDFTVNALALAFPGARLVAPAGALDDLAARRLRLPRAGVLLEDPLRVARAARFLARLPGFRLDPSMRPELSAAAEELDAVAPERRLAELDAILAVGPAPAARALRQLETWGGLAALLPGIAASERRRGLAALDAVRRDASPALLRALLLSGALPDRMAAALDALRASRSDRRLAATLGGLPAPSPRPDTTEAIRLLRRAAPFSREAITFVEATGGRAGRALARHADAVLAAPGALGRVLNPRRPVAVAEVAALLGVAGPDLGRALALLDDALATGAIRGARQARAFLSGRPRPAPSRGRRKCLPV